MLWISSGKLYHLSNETRMERKKKVFVKVLWKVKLVLVNIRFRLDINMPVMVTNPGIGFGAWHSPPHCSLVWLQPLCHWSLWWLTLLQQSRWHPTNHSSINNSWKWARLLWCKPCWWLQLGHFNHTPQRLRQMQLHWVC